MSLPKFESCRLLAVSKLQSAEKIKALYSEGQRLFGENYVQEALTKMEQLRDLDIEWHLIGHLQKKKVKSIVGRFALIHSVDSLELLQKIGQLSAERQLTQKVLLQVNVAQEESKEGFSKAQLFEKWPALVNVPGVAIEGLMTMPPLSENPEEARPYFKQLREIRNDLQKITEISHHKLTELSMGTSHDYKVALEEGATIVRLGTILFGERTSKEVKSP